MRGEAGDRVPFESTSQAGMLVTLRVSLGEMDLQEALHVTLPSMYVRMSVREFLDKVFREGPAQDAIRASFDLKENPDLPEMYDAVLEVFREWRNARCSLRFFANHGSEIALSDELRRHLMARMSDRQGGPADAMLDLVIEQRYRPLDYAIERGYADSKEHLVVWLQAHTLLYFLDRHEFKFEVDPKSEADQQLLPIACQLRETNLLESSQEASCFEITDEGRQVLANMIGETETYIDRYDVFQDVLYDWESESAMFGSGRGEDLRVPVYEAEGLDSLRTVFLLLLYDSVLDGYRSDWREAIADGEFYDELLAPVVDHQDVDKAQLESIIESGFVHVEEQDECSRKLAAQQKVMASAEAKRHHSIEKKNDGDAVSKLPSR